VPHVIVIGVGGVGAFALRELARRGVSVLGLEAFQVGHDRGSSHGGTRVFRHAYFEHADYVPLLRHSTEVFRELGASSGRPLLNVCGTLLIGKDGCPDVAAASVAAQQHSVPVESLSADEVAARYPQFRVPADHHALFEPGGGFVRPEASIRAAVDDAKSHGAELREGVRVVGIEERADGVVVRTDVGELRADRVIATAGAWTSQLLPDLAPQLRVTRQVQGWIEPRDPVLGSPAKLPTWFVVRTGAPPVYGIPIDPEVAGPPRVKVALHGLSELLDPNAPRRPVDDTDRAQLMAAVTEWMPHLEGDLVDAKTCLYTVTPDEHFIVDYAPGYERVCVVAGLSGHGFKMTPALGRAAADLTLAGTSELPSAFLSADRFAT